MSDSLHYEKAFGVNFTISFFPFVTKISHPCVYYSVFKRAEEAQNCIAFVTQVVKSIYP